MQTSAGPYSFIRHAGLVLILTFFLPGGLSITPVQAADGGFSWARAMGGSSFDGASEIFVDTSGNVYTTGSFWGTADFDPGPGTFYLTSAGEADIFLSKLNSDGNFVWAKAIGGYFLDEGNDISVDSSGNIFITGFFRGTAGFDPGPSIVGMPRIFKARPPVWQYVDFVEDISFYRA